MKSVVICVTNDLTTDQRVDRVCNVLKDNGFKLLLIGRKLPSSLPISRNYPTKRLRLLFNRGFLFYVEYNIRLFFVLLFLKKDILLANDLDTLLPNFLVSKIQGKKLVYDSHELFTEVPELVNRPVVKKIWNWLESVLLPKIKNSYTVCQSIADIYNKKYKTDFKVIRNFPVKKELIMSSFPFDTEGKKIILYQGAVNMGRGISLMIETMNFLDNHIFIVIGDGDIFDDLQKQATAKNLEEKVHFMGRIPPEDLHKLTPLADMGISLEQDIGLNYRFALPNKIFDYIQAEVPVLVSDLPEMRQVVSDYKVGEVITDRKPEKLAIQIEKFLKKDFSTELKSAKEILNWELEKQKLVDIFKNLK